MSTPDLPIEITEHRPDVIVRRLLDALDSIPTDPRATSRLLRMHGIRGHSSSTTASPLALYLTARAGCTVSVDSIAARIDHPDHWAVQVVHGPRVRAFLDAYACGDFPWLDGDPTFGTLIEYVQSRAALA